MVLRQIGDELKNIYKKYFLLKSDQKKIKLLFADIANVLKKHGFLSEFIDELQVNICNVSGYRFKFNLFDMLLKMLKSLEYKVKFDKKKSNIVYFIGIQGSGKTTSIVKYARHLKKKCRFRTVGVICADTFRAGAYYQLKQNCSKMSIPFYGELSELDPIKLIERGFEYFGGYQIILVDTSGRNMNDTQLTIELKQMLSLRHYSKRILVVDGTSGYPIWDQVKFFNSKIGFDSCFITKLDCNVSLGGSPISAMYMIGKPIEFIGTGEHLEMLEKFNAEKITKEILGYQKMKKIDFDDIEERKKFFTNVGNVCLNEIVYEMKIYMKRMDQMSDMFSMFGFDFGQIKNKMHIESNRLFVITNSMTTKEKNNPKFELYTKNIKRMRRIALGSGYTIKEVIVFIKKISHVYHTTMKNMVKKMNFPSSIEIPKNVFSSII